MFKGGIISIYKDLALYNEIDVQFCTNGRHRECSLDGECDMCRPRCTTDELSMVGKGLHQNLTKNDRKKIERDLHKLFKICRPISIQVQEI